MSQILIYLSRKSCSFHLLNLFADCKPFSGGLCHFLLRLLADHAAQSDEEGTLPQKMVSSAHHPHNFPTTIDMRDAFDGINTERE